MVNRLHSFSAKAGFSWSPNKYLLAAGSAFEDSTLEIFKLDLDRDSSQYKTTIKTGFNAIAWGSVNSQKTYGIIATGKEHGELELWDPLAILNHKNSEECLMMKNTMHTSKINSLDFNLFQTNLLASAGNQNEVYIWDLNNPHTPYGPRSSKMDHVRTVAWNGQVQHILSTASTNGFTTIWDLRNKKEIMILPQHSNPISSIAWHPDNATQIITASDDATMSLWDLRHAHAPEKTLKGHSGSVLSISWCRQDPNLLTSSGSDGQILLWNPNTAELHGKIADYKEGAFQVNWCPHQPHLLASASLEGSIDIHSIQSFKLKSSPRWLRRPIGTSFGHSGKLVTFQKKTVHITSIDTDPDIIKRSEQLESATSDLVSVDAFIQDRIRISNKEDWKLLRTLFSDNAREQVIRHLGFQKEHILSTAQSLNNRRPPKTISALFTSETESFFSQMTPLDLLPKSPIDRSITEAIVLGDFETAVDLCLNSERYSDALLIASCGGPELFEQVQKVYIERHASRHSYLLVLKSLLDQDLGSIVNQASLDHWSLVLAILCTFSSPDEFGILGETLGDRLAGAHKSNAALICYLVSGQFIKVSDHWISQEDQSLQELVEKVTIYRKAIHYQDQALLSEGPYPLASLYQKYCEYAQWMITQDKLQIALKYIQLVPSQFPGRQKLLLSIQQSSPPGSDHYYTAPRQWH